MDPIRASQLLLLCGVSTVAVAILNALTGVMGGRAWTLYLLVCGGGIILAATYLWRLFRRFFAKPS